MNVSDSEIIKKLESLANPTNVEGMKRFGIFTETAFGVSAPVLKQIAKDVKKTVNNRHSLALELWKSGIYEARIIASLIDNPHQVTERQADSWAGDFDNWAICDSTCGHLFSRTKFAYDKAFEWAECEAEFVKRAGLVLPAWLAVHDKKAADEKIARFLPLLESKSNDERNLIKKAVSWSLRQIGKRSFFLNNLAVETAERIKLQDSKSSRWIAADVLRELTDKKILERITGKNL